MSNHLAHRAPVKKTFFFMMRHPNATFLLHSRHQAVFRGCGARGVEVRHALRPLRHAHHHAGCHLLQHKEEGAHIYIYIVRLLYIYTHIYIDSQHTLHKLGTTTFLSSATQRRRCASVAFLCNECITFPLISTHELQIDLSAPAAFYFRLVLETSCIVNAPRPT